MQDIYSIKYSESIDELMEVLQAIFEQREAELHSALIDSSDVTLAQARFDATADIIVNLPRIKAMKLGKCLKRHELKS